MKLVDAHKKDRRKHILPTRKEALRKADKFGNKVIRRIDAIHKG